MSILRKFLILIVLIVCFYVVYQLYKHRMEIFTMKYNSQQQNNTFKEGYTDATVTSLEINNSVSPNIKSYLFQNLTPELGIQKNQKKISQFCIKSSCNSAYDGKNVSTDMIQYVLKRGCRFLDFEIYWANPTLPDGKDDTGQTTPVAVVSVSNDPTTPGTNSISFYSVMKYIQQNGFNNSVCPNANDPLFIQLRIKYSIPLNKVNNQKNLYNSVAETVQNLLSQYLFSSRVNSDTDISLLAGKAVIIMDTYANRNYVQISNKLSKIVNIESNSDSLTHTTYEDIITEVENSHSVDNNGYVMNIKKMQQVLPMSTVNSVQYLFTDNYNSMSVISRYNVQFALMAFWKNDSYLEAYEKMFNNNGTAIIMLSSAMNYSEGQQVIPSIVYP